MYTIRTTIDILTLLGLLNYGTHYHLKSSRLPHLICLKTAFLIFMFLRDQVIPLQVRMLDIASVLCNLHVHSLVFFHLHFFFTFYNFILSTFLNIEARSLARSQLGRKFCSFPLSRPIYFDNTFFVCNYVTNCIN